jgi:hypothetical protein
VSPHVSSELFIGAGAKRTLLTSVRISRSMHLLVVRLDRIKGREFGVWTQPADKV